MKRIMFLYSALSLFLLTSCLKDVGNSQTFPVSSAVVHYYTEFPGITFLDTPHGSYAAPALNGRGYQTGDCLYVSFTLDYDNQPNANYYQITDIFDKKIQKSNIVMLDADSQTTTDTIAALSVDSIKGVGFGSDLYYCIDNNLFLGFDQFDINQHYEYQLVYSDSLINNIPVLYVCVKESHISSATLYGDHRFQAFDIKPFLERYADDKNSFSFYLRYKKGVDASNENVYAYFSVEPVTLTNLYFPDSYFSGN